jgi:hypothetical protein
MNRLTWIVITLVIVAWLVAVKTHSTTAEIIIWKGTKYMNKIVKWYANIITFFGDFWYVAGRGFGRLARWFEDVRGDFTDGYRETRHHPSADQIMYGRVGFPAGIIDDLMKNAGRVPEAPESHARGSKTDPAPVDTTGR